VPLVYPPKPTASDLTFAVVFFVVVNGALVAWGMRRVRAAHGVFRILFWLPPLPLILLTSKMSWDWLHDPTADNLWPIGMVIWAVPCGILELILRALQRNARRRAETNRAG